MEGISRTSWISGIEKRVQLRFLSQGNIETEVATSYSQLGLSVGVEGHQHTHKNFNAKFVLPTRCTRIKRD